MQGPVEKPFFVPHNFATDEGYSLNNGAIQNKARCGGFLLLYLPTLIDLVAEVELKLFRIILSSTVVIREIMMGGMVKKAFVHSQKPTFRPISTGRITSPACSVHLIFPICYKIYI